MRGLRRYLALLAVAVAILGFAGGCGDDGTGCETKGDLCTVVLQQGGDSEAEAFGYRVRLVSITDETVTVTVDDEPFRVSNAHPGRLSAAFALELRLKEKGPPTAGSCSSST